MDELITFLALGNLVEKVTEIDCEEFLPQEVSAKIDAYVDRADSPPAEETATRLIASFLQATDRLLMKIDEEAS